jgi:hypothetical protein
MCYVKSREAYNFGANENFTTYGHKMQAEGARLGITVMTLVQGHFLSNHS